ncbi:MAG TPA: hypothetical protein VIV35_06230 [Chitinophagaceae bacterium]
MKKIIVLLFTGSLFTLACRKSDFLQLKTETEPCVVQTDNPTGRSYSSDSIVSYTCTSKHCGLLPLSSKNYWIYEDSIFSDGVFTKVQVDTLRYITNKKSLPDGLVWWKGNIPVGLPDILYANDSSFFGLAERLFTPDIKDVKKEFGLFPGDSLRYLTSFEDAAALGRSLKYETPLETSAGTFHDCFYFEKNARNYRKDQVFFKTGIGVVKYILEKAPIGQRVIKLQQVSTLVSFHIE